MGLFKFSTRATMAPNQTTLGTGVPRDRRYSDQVGTVLKYFAWKAIQLSCPP